MEVKNKFKIKNFFRILGVIITIVPIIIMLYQNYMRNSSMYFMDINYILLIIFEAINIIGTVVLFKRKDNLKKCT